jgi:hypothetical protein
MAVATRAFTSPAQKKKQMLIKRTAPIYVFLVLVVIGTLQIAVTEGTMLAQTNIFPASGPVGAGTTTPSAGPALQATTAAGII